MKKNNMIVKIFTYCISTILLLVSLFPLYLTVVMSFKTQADTHRSFFALPTSLYLDNFVAVFQKSKLVIIFMNSLLITSVSAVCIVFLVSACSYAISRNPGKLYYKILYYIIICGVFIPFSTLVVPIVRLANFLNLSSPAGIIPIYIGISFSSNVFLVVGYLKSVPIEIDESAFMDGASVFTTFFSIILPIVKPITMTVAILSSLWVWNDFFMPLVLLNREMSYWTLPIFQYNFGTGYAFNYNQASAAMFISIVPIVAFYILLQKHIISGLVAGSVKG